MTVDHDWVETEFPVGDELPPPPRRPCVLADPIRALAGYELGDEIGRGGMGVVYRARDRKLDRPVALKVILDGAFADRELRERFVAEARAIARMQHPNIVQVFEVGDDNGVPFMALELVQGGTLAQAVGGGPLPGKSAAALVETMARAVAYAHSRGIVHRDLKPANVLFDAAGDWSETELSTPHLKIADFGLAKQMGDDSNQTRTGMIVGTPSYMAPEQIGESAAIGPAVDIYALGAILYELLTGRPPFKAASAFETLDLVRTRPPVAPSVLQPGVARDINTICMKCLEKDPARRFATAEALADDLRRFLDGRPVLARPVGPVERSWRWAKRNPRIAALLTALVIVVLAGSGGVFSQWRRAERNFVEVKKERDAANTERATAELKARELQQAINDMEYLIRIIDNDQIFHMRTKAPRKELLLPALRANREFIERFGSDPEREPEVVSAKYRVAMLTRLVGGQDEALKAGLEALAAQRDLCERHLDVVQYRRDLGAAYHNVGWLLHLGPSPQEQEEALAHLKHARLIREEFVAAQPENLDYLSELGGCLNDIGLCHFSLHQHRDAEAAYLIAVDQQRRAFDRAHHVPRYRLLLCNHFFNRARNFVAMNRFGESVALAKEFLALQPDDAETLIRFARILAFSIKAREVTSFGDDMLVRAVRAAVQAEARDLAVIQNALKWHPELKVLEVDPDFRALSDRVRLSQGDIRLLSAPRQ